jgi:hypothetical protein
MNGHRCSGGPTGAPHPPPIIPPSRLWACSPLCGCADPPRRRPRRQHSPHDSLVVVPSLPRGPAVHAPAAVRPSASGRAPSAGLQQAVVESVGAGLVVTFPLVAAARGRVGRLGGGECGRRSRGRGSRWDRRRRGARRCPPCPGRRLVVIVVVVGRLQGQEVPLLRGHGEAAQWALPRAEHAGRGRGRAAGAAGAAAAPAARAARAAAVTVVVEVEVPQPLGRLPDLHPQTIGRSELLWLEPGDPRIHQTAAAAAPAPPGRPQGRRRRRCLRRTPALGRRRRCHPGSATGGAVAQGAWPAPAASLPPSGLAGPPPSLRPSAEPLSPGFPCKWRRRIPRRASGGGGGGGGGSSSGGGGGSGGGSGTRLLRSVRAARPRGGASAGSAPRSAPPAPPPRSPRPVPAASRPRVPRGRTARHRGRGRLQAAGPQPPGQPSRASLAGVARTWASGHLGRARRRRTLLPLKRRRGTRGGCRLRGK